MKGRLDYVTAETRRNDGSLSLFPPNTIILTPTGDATLTQRSLSNDAGRVIQTAGPWLATLPTYEGSSPVQMGGNVAFDLLRFGLVTGGFKGLQGRLVFPSSRAFGPIDLGAVGQLAFDLTSAKAFLQSAKLSPTNVRASLRVTPVRTGTMEQFATEISPALPVRSETTVALLDTKSGPTQTISFSDFPGFSGLAGPARSNLNDLERTIAQAPVHRKVALPLGSAVPLSQLSFDVTDSIQRELLGQGPRASAGFILASELNGTGVIFADSSWAAPGAQEILAPHLVLELPGFKPPTAPTFVISTTKIPFDWLRQESRDLSLVTISNLGASAGKVRANLPSGSAFGLIAAPAAALNLDATNSAMIPAGGQLTFGVTFKPKKDVREPDSQTLQILDTTSLFGREIGRIQLEGQGVPDNTGGVPAIVAPITPQFAALPSTRRWAQLHKSTAMPWLFGSLFLAGLFSFGRARARRRGSRSN